MSPTKGKAAAQTTVQATHPEREVSGTFQQSANEQKVVRTAIELGSIWSQASLLLRVARESAVVVETKATITTIEPDKVSWGRFYDLEGCMPGVATGRAVFERDWTQGDQSGSPKAGGTVACVDFRDQERVTVLWMGELSFVSVEQGRKAIAIKFTSGGSSLFILKQNNGVWCCGKVDESVEVPMPITPLSLDAQQHESLAEKLLDYEDIIHQASERLTISQQLMAKGAMEILAARLSNCQKEQPRK